MIKGFIFDIDGTIYYNPERKVPESTYNALRQLKEKGYKIAFCTAREKAKLRTLPHQLMEFADVVIVGSGAACYKDYYLYWSNNIKQEDLEKYVDYFNEHDSISYGYSLENGKMYYWGDVDDNTVKAILKWCGRMPLMRRMRKTDKVNSIDLRYVSDEDYDNILAINPNVRPIKWTKNAFFNAENIDKATGIDLFCDAFGFNRDEICAFGDGDFDAAMVKEAGIGIALKDSELAKLNVADYVTDKNILDGGVYEMLVKLGFIERYIPDIKIIFFDIDGTSFDHSIYDVRPSTYKALKLLRRYGIKTCIATSRSIEEMKMLPKEFLDAMDGYITCAGAHTRFKSEKIEIAKVMDKDAVNRALKLMDENDITYRYTLKDGSGYINKDDEEILQLFDRLYHCRPTVKEYAGEEVIHLLYYTKDEQLRAKVHSILNDCSHLHFVLSNEIMCKDTDKSIDMLRLAEMLGYKKENVAAFGDSFNDIDMLQRAELGVCMGNGREITKLSADYITDDISEEGLYNALIKYGYIKE